MGTLTTNHSLFSNPALLGMTFNQPGSLQAGLTQQAGLAGFGYHPGILNNTGFVLSPFANPLYSSSSYPTPRYAPHTPIQMARYQGALALRERDSLIGFIHHQRRQLESAGLQIRLLQNELLLERQRSAALHAQLGSAGVLSTPQPQENDPVAATTLTQTTSALAVITESTPPSPQTPVIEETPATRFTRQNNVQIFAPRARQVLDESPLITTAVAVPTTNSAETAPTAETAVPSLPTGTASRTGAASQEIQITPPVASPEIAFLDATQTTTAIANPIEVAAILRALTFEIEDETIDGSLAFTSPETSTLFGEPLSPSDAVTLQALTKQKGALLALADFIEQAPAAISHQDLQSIKSTFIELNALDTYEYAIQISPNGLLAKPVLADLISQGVLDRLQLNGLILPSTQATRQTRSTTSYSRVGRRFLGNNTDPNGGGDQQQQQQQQ